MELHPRIRLLLVPRMNTTMQRNCFEPGGFVYEFLDGKCRTLPANVAYVVNGREPRDVTWDEVMAGRRQRQAERMERIRQPAKPAVQPCYVWTFFNRQDIPFHGWYCYVVTRHGDTAVHGKYGLGEVTLAESIMAAIPLGMLPLADNFDSWMEAFARRHPRRKLKGDPRKAGALHGWLKHRKTFSLTRPNDL